MLERFPAHFAGARDRIRDERGFAVPTVLLMLLAAFSVVTIGVVSAIGAQSGSVRDEQSKSAVQLAQAGISQALLRYNTYYSTVSPLTLAAPCIGSSGSPAALVSGWCPGVPATVTGGTSTYYVRPTWTNGYPAAAEIVGYGVVSGIERRVDVNAVSASGQQVFLNASVQAQNLIALDANAQITAGAQSGGDYTMASNSKQCGLTKVGIGKHMTLSGNAKYYTDTACTTLGSASTVPQGSLTLPPVNQGNAASVNDDQRIANAAAGSGTPSDLVSGNRSDITWTGNGATQRQLTIGHNSSLTLTGSTYSLCKLTTQQNASIYVAAGLSVTIYFDSPEHCGLSPVNGTVNQLDLSSNSRISDATGSASAIALLFVGSPTIATQALMSSNTQVSGACVQNFVVYAPLTDLEMNSNSQYCGAVAAKTIHLDSNATIQATSSSSSYTLPGTPPHYAVSRFVECGDQFASPPNSGC